MDCLKLIYKEETLHSMVHVGCRVSSNKLNQKSIWTTFIGQLIFKAWDDDNWRYSLGAKFVLQSLDWIFWCATILFSKVVPIFMPKVDIWKLQNPPGKIPYSNNVCIEPIRYSGYACILNREFCNFSTSTVVQ